MIGQRLIGSHLTSFMLRSQREGLQVIAAMSASGRRRTLARTWKAQPPANLESLGSDLTPVMRSELILSGAARGVRPT